MDGPNCSITRAPGRNSFIDIMERGPERVWIRWTYFGVNMKRRTGLSRHRRFWAFANGLILRRQWFESLRPTDPNGYAREPIEMIGMCPVGKLWFDVLAKE